MIIDCHSHLGPVVDQDAADYWRKNRRLPDSTVENYLKAMERVNRAVLIGIEWGPPNINRNECIAHFVREQGQKFVPVYNINPTLPTAGSDLERVVQDWGAKGIKLAPVYQGFKPDDECYFPFYERIQQMRLPIIWHQGTSLDAPDGPLEWANPVLLDKVARTFPDLRMVVAHFGYPWVREVVALIRKRPNVYTDVSALATRTWTLYSALVDATQYGAIDKVFFGSDYAWFSPSRMQAALQEVSSFPEGTNLPKLPREVIGSILNCNPLELLGIA